MNNILRYRLDYLTQREQLWLLHEQPYTGLAYEFDKGYLIHVHDIQNGMVIGESDDVLQADGYDNPIRMELELLESQDDPDAEPSYDHYYQLDGKAVNAFIYEFIEGQLAEESFMVEGDYECPARSWVEGNLTRFSRKNHRNEWFLSGELHKEIIKEQGSWIFSIEFSEPNTLITLWIEPGYQSYAPSFKHIEVQGRLLLLRKGINDSILQKVIELPGFKDLELLLLSNTSVSVLMVASLNLSHIKEFSFERDENPAAHAPMLTALKILKGKYPQCRIAYGHDEVMI